MLLRVILVALSLLLIAPIVASAQLEENWDSVEQGANGWVMFGTSGGTPVQWTPAPGKSGGYIFTNLSDVTRWPTPANFDFYPAYCLKPVDLTANPKVSIQVKDFSLTAPLDLGGGQLRYWIGEEIEVGGTWYATYYSYKTPIAIGAGWTTTELNLSQSPAAWELISDDQGKTPAQLMASNNMHGFHIWGGTDDPSGVLGFDNFSVAVPEPSSLVALAAAAASVVMLRKRSA